MKNRNKNMQNQSGQLKEKIKRQQKRETSTNRQDPFKKKNQQDHTAEQQIEETLNPFSKKNCLIQLAYLIVLVLALLFLIYYFTQ